MNHITQFSLHLADSALVLGHRNSEWTGHGPILEQDIALSNISLDLIGQARNFYQYAAEMIGGTATEDSLAYTRDENEYRNCLIAEQENGDWGKTIMRQFLFSAWQYPLYNYIKKCTDQQLSAISEKSIKEVTYHLRWSSEWVIRLGQGTEESHRRMTNAINELWMFTEDLITPANYEIELMKHLSADGIDLPAIWQTKVKDILSQAGLSIPVDVKMITGGKEGKHTGHLKNLLDEMQYMQRTYPGVEW